MNLEVLKGSVHIAGGEGTGQMNLTVLVKYQYHAQIMCVFICHACIKGDINN